MRFRIPRLRPPAFGGEDPQSPLAGAAVLSPLLLDTSTPCPPAGLYGRMDEKNKKLIDLGNSSSGISSVGTLFRGRAIASSTRARGGVTFVLVVVGGGVRDLGCGREMSPRGNHCDEHFGNTHTHTHTHTHDEGKKKKNTTGTTGTGRSRTNTGAPTKTSEIGGPHALPKHRIARWRRAPSRLATRTFWSGRPPL